MEVWKIAIGVCLGLVAFAGIDRYLEARREAAEIAALNASFAKANTDLQRMQATERAKRESHELRKQALAEAQYEATRLKADERCISGQRFQRVENGWVQTGSC